MLTILMVSGEQRYCSYHGRCAYLLHLGMSATMLVSYDFIYPVLHKSWLNFSVHTQ